MSDLIKKTILTGLGIASLTKGKAESLVQDLIKEGEVSEGEGSKLVKELLEKVEDNKKTMENKIEKTVYDVLKKLNIPSRKDITSLNSKIEKLEKKLSNEKK